MSRVPFRQSRLRESFSIPTEPFEIADKGFANEFIGGLWIPSSPYGLHDITEQAADLSLPNGASWGQSPCGAGLLFDGSSQYATAPIPPGVDVFNGGGFSVGFSSPLTSSWPDNQFILMATSASSNVYIGSTYGGFWLNYMSGGPDTNPGTIPTNNAHNRLMMMRGAGGLQGWYNGRRIATNDWTGYTGDPFTTFNLATNTPTAGFSKCIITDAIVFKNDPQQYGHLLTADTFGFLLRPKKKRTISIPTPTRNKQVQAGTITWTVPADWNNANNKIYLVGEGGNGCTASGTTGGGGGGGFRCISNITLTPDTSIPIIIGTGGTGTDTNWNSGQAIAKAGGNATPTAAGLGGGAGSDTAGGYGFAGGNGGQQVPAYQSLSGSGGGGAGGPFGVGGAGGSGGNGYQGAGGGGGNGGGTAGQIGQPSESAGAGGKNALGTGSGPTGRQVRDGMNGGGGGGSDSTYTAAGNGGNGNDFDGATIGGGGGGGGAYYYPAGNGGLFGGGGGGGVKLGSGGVGVGGLGAPGAVFITYQAITPTGATVQKNVVLYFIT